MKIATLPYNLLFILFLIGFTIASNDITNQLSQFDSSPWGQKVLDVVQVQLTLAGDHVADVLRILNKMQANLELEGNNSAALHVQIQEDCNQTIAQLQTQLAASDEQKSNLQGLADALNIQVDENTGGQAASQNVVAALTTSLQEMQTQRAREKHMYQKDIVVIVRLVAALQRVREIIKGLTPSPVASSTTTGTGLFAQIPAMKAEVEEMEIDQPAVKSLQAMAMVVIKMMTERSGDGGFDAKLVAKVDRVILRIIERLKDLQEDLTRIEYTKGKVHKASVLGQEGFLLEATSSTNRFTDQLRTVQQKLLQVGVDSAALKKLRKQKNAEVVDKSKQCQDENDTFSAAFSERDDQLAIIEKVITMVQNNVQPVKNYVANRRPAA